ncbi:hypothetical protein AGDE_16849 [Angomonas deanei]|nr:hypothetical protein AGDE_16849 [Angomonas deanei]|eukprot:EPY16060.1 hypothetical protein AGDE_16849 [Angomonas deanei]
MYDSDSDCSSEDSQQHLERTTGKTEAGWRDIDENVKKTYDKKDFFMFNMRQARNKVQSVFLKEKTTAPRSYEMRNVKKPIPKKQNTHQSDSHSVKRSEHPAHEEREKRRAVEGPRIIFPASAMQAESKVRYYENLFQYSLRKSAVWVKSPDWKSLDLPEGEKVDVLQRTPPQERVLTSPNATGNPSRAPPAHRSPGAAAGSPPYHLPNTQNPRYHALQKPHHGGGRFGYSANQSSPAPAVTNIQKIGNGRLRDTQVVESSSEEDTSSEEDSSTTSENEDASHRQAADSDLNPSQRALCYDKEVEYQTFFFKPSTPEEGERSRPVDHTPTARPSDREARGDSDNRPLADRENKDVSSFFYSPPVVAEKREGEQHGDVPSPVRSNPQSKLGYSLFSFPANSTRNPNRPLYGKNPIIQMKQKEATQKRLSDPKPDRKPNHTTPANTQVVAQEEVSRGSATSCGDIYEYDFEEYFFC